MLIRSSLFFFSRLTLVYNVRIFLTPEFTCCAKCA